MKGKTLIYVGIYAAAAYGVYYLFFSKSALANTIIKSGNYSSPKKDLMEFGANFLKPWAKASKNGQPTFIFQGKTYNTKGGRAKQ